jgi:two-component system, LuxR family, response regulator FixJ
METKAPYIHIVDDDPSVRKALARLLASHGLPVETYGSGEEFLAKYVMGSPGCIITDVRMPGLSGVELLRKLTSFGSTLPVIVLTAYDDETARRQAIADGAAVWLLKPVKAEDLLNAIDSVTPWRSETSA